MRAMFIGGSNEQTADREGRMPLPLAALDVAVACIQW